MFAKRQCVLVANNRREKSTYWNLTQGQLSNPVDVENRDKVFKFYTDNIVVPKITAVCSICHDDFRNNSRKSDKDWEVYLGKDGSTNPLKRHLMKVHKNEIKHKLTRSYSAIDWWLARTH